VTAPGHADEQHERIVEWTARYTVVEPIKAAEAR
jgi:hypothetical protein